MTSLSVGGSSYLEGGLSLGKTSEYGQQTLVFQGSVEETIVHSNPILVNKTHHEVTGEPAAGDRWSTTRGTSTTDRRGHFLRSWKSSAFRFAQKTATCWSADLKRQQRWTNPERQAWPGKRGL